MLKRRVRRDMRLNHCMRKLALSSRSEFCPYLWNERDVHDDEVYKVDGRSLRKPSVVVVFRDVVGHRAVLEP